MAEDALASGLLAFSGELVGGLLCAQSAPEPSKQKITNLRFKDIAVILQFQNRNATESLCKHLDRRDLKPLVLLVHNLSRAPLCTVCARRGAHGPPGAQTVNGGRRV